MEPAVNLITFLGKIILSTKKKVIHTSYKENLITYTVFDTRIII